MPDDYSFYRAALAGENPEPTPGSPGCGWFRRAGKDRETRELAWVPVAIWRGDDGKLLALDGPRLAPELDEIDEIFARSCRQPVPSEVYYAVTEEGAPWPDEVRPPEPGVGHNAQDLAAHERLLAQINALKEEARLWLKSIGAVTTQSQADKAGNFADRFQRLEREAESTRKREKEPHLEAGREVDAAWAPVVDEAKNAKAGMKKKLEAFLIAERTRRQEAERRAREEAERAAREAGVDPAAVQVKVTTGPVRAGNAGRSTVLRTVKALRYTDFRAAFAHYAADERLFNHPDVLRVVGRLAEGDLAAGRSVPGAVLDESQQAA